VNKRLSADGRVPTRCHSGDGPVFILLHPSGDKESKGGEMDKAGRYPHADAAELLIL